MDTNNVQINTFAKGMDTDTSDALISSDSYRYAENLRYITDGESNSGELHLIDGGIKVGSFQYNKQDVEITKVLGTATNRDFGAVVVVGNFPVNPIEDEVDDDYQDPTNIYIKNVDVSINTTDVIWDYAQECPRYDVSYIIKVKFNTTLEGDIKLGYYLTYDDFIPEAWEVLWPGVPEQDIPPMFKPSGALLAGEFHTGSIKVSRGSNSVTIPIKGYGYGSSNANIKKPKRIYLTWNTKESYDNIFYQKNEYGDLQTKLYYDAGLSSYTVQQPDNKILITHAVTGFEFYETSKKTIRSISVSQDSTIQFELDEEFSTITIANEEELQQGNCGEITVTFLESGGDTEDETDDVLKSCTFQVIVTRDVSPDSQTAPDDKMLCFKDVPQNFVYPPYVSPGVTFAFTIHRHTRQWAKDHNLEQYCGEYNHLYEVYADLLKGLYTQDDVYNGLLEQAFETYPDAYDNSKFEINSNDVYLVNAEYENVKKQFSLHIPFEKSQSNHVYLTPNDIDSLNDFDYQQQSLLDGTFARVISFDFQPKPTDPTEYNVITFRYLIDKNKDPEIPDEPTPEPDADYNGIIESFTIGNEIIYLTDNTIRVPISKLVPLEHPDPGLSYQYKITLNLRKQDSSKVDPTKKRLFYGYYATQAIDVFKEEASASSGCVVDTISPLEVDYVPDYPSAGRTLSCYLQSRVKIDDVWRLGTRPLVTTDSAMEMELSGFERWVPSENHLYDGTGPSYVEFANRTYLIKLVDDSSVPSKSRKAPSSESEEPIIKEGWAIYKLTDQDPKPQLVFGPCFEPIAKNYSHKISSVLNYENDNVVKLYIADGEHPILICNIIKHTDDVIYTELKDICGFSGKAIEEIKSLSSTTGAQKNGVLRYVYRLYNERGAISQMSPISKAMAVFAEDVDTNGKLLFKGPTNEQSVIGIQLRIEDNSGYNRIQIYRIQYTDSVTPKVYLIADQHFDKQLDFVDYPVTALQQYTIEEINRLFDLAKIPEIIQSKDNYLFAANMKEQNDKSQQTFSSWDARSYSHGSTKGGTNIWESGLTKDDIFEIEPGDDHADENNYLKDEVRQSLLAIDTAELIGNPNLSLDVDYSSAAWMFPDSISWIGIGPNIRWKFIFREGAAAEDGVLSSYAPHGPILPMTSSEIGVLYRPDNIDTKERIIREISERRKLSLRRDEIYRYGIILYSKSGYQSPVKWIADIRTPNIGETGYELYSPLAQDNYSTLRAKPLGIQFRVDYLPEDCIGYEIVRVDRTINDRATLTQGVMAPTLDCGNYELCPTGLPSFSKMCVCNSNLPITSNKHEENYKTRYESLCEEMKSRLEYDSTDLNRDSMPSGVTVTACSTPTVLQVYSPEATFTPSSIGQKLESRKIKCQVIAKSEFLSGDYVNVSEQLATTSEGALTSLVKEDLNLYSVFPGKVYMFNSTQFAGSGYIKTNTKGNLLYDESVAPQLFSTSLVWTSDEGAYNMFDANKWLALQGAGGIGSEDSWDANRFFLYKSPAFNYLQYFQTTPLQQEFLLNSVNVVRDIADGNEFDNALSVGVLTVGEYAFFPWVAPQLIYSNYTTKQRWERQTNFDINSDLFYKDCIFGGIWYASWSDQNIITSIEGAATRFPSGPGSRSILIRPNNQITGSVRNVYDNGSIGRTVLCNLRQYGVVPYGGQTRQSIDSAVYTRYGDYKAKLKNAINTIDVFDGDCFINAFEFCTKHKWYHGTYCDTYQASVFASVIVESDIDLDVTYGAKFSSIREKQGELSATYLQNHSVSLVVPEGNSTSVINFGTNNTPNQYNPAYSATASAILKGAQSTQTVQNLFDTRIFNSSQKKADELLDSWIDIYSFNYIDVDAKHGAITQLKTVGERLLFWQEDAVGVLSVNERAQVMDTTRNNLLLGSGGVAQRFDYITTQNGMHLHDFSDAVSNGMVYWYDRKRNNICSYGSDGFKQLSKALYINDLLTSPNRTKTDLALADDYHTSIDHKQNEVLFHVLNAGAIVFSENTGRFASVYTNTPVATVSFYDNLYNIYLNGTNNTIERWNKSDRTTSKANDKRLLPFIKYVVNKNASQTKVYDNGEISGKLVMGNGDIQMTFDSALGQHATIDDSRLRDVDYSGNLYTSAFSVREDNIRFAVPRNNNSQEYGDRLRGRHMTCSLSSSSNKLDFSIQYITTKYRISWS